MAAQNFVAGEFEQTAAPLPSEFGSTQLGFCATENITLSLGTQRDGFIMRLAFESMARRAECVHSLRRWLFVEAMLPVFFVVALYWPLGSVIIHPGHWFERVFASADLVPLAAIVLLGSACEIEQNRLFNSVSSGWLETLRYGALALGIICLFLYGFCKTAYLAYSFDDTKPVSDNVKWIAVFSLVSIGTGMLYSAVAKLVTICKTPN